MTSEKPLKGLLSSHVWGGSQRILPRLRSAVTPDSAHFQGLQGTVAKSCPYSGKGPDKEQMAMLCLSTYLKSCLCEMGKSTKMPMSFGFHWPMKPVVREQKLISI